MQSSAVWLSVWAIGIACFDARYLRIPNALTLSAWVFGLAVLVAQHATLLNETLQQAGLAMLFSALVTLPGYALKKLGAADVKYLIAIALLTTLAITVTAFIVAALLGGAMAVSWLVLPHLALNAPPALRRHQPLMQWLLKPASQRRMPFGALLSIGLLGTLWK